MKVGDLVINRVDGGLGWCHPFDRSQTPGVLVRVTHDPITGGDPEWRYLRPVGEVLWHDGVLVSHPLEDLMPLEDHLEDMRHIQKQADYDDRFVDAGEFRLDDIEEADMYSIYPQAGVEWL